ncbi:MAG: tetratricopeptide repeat protein, partial [Paludibacter sp.]|nr:tetratricopeptide repeat protein [Paludibacter sp.]
MNNKISHIILFCVAIFFAAGCSLKKNTAYTRNYQALNTKFNVYFNGYTSYNEGLKAINDANADNFSTVIPMYPISKHDNAKAATSTMERAIEKSRKAIKQRSIKQKPKRDPKRWRDPKYHSWYEQEEFNPELRKAWMLLAQAEFHKADFLGSVGTFSYIVNHYSTDRDLVVACRLWTVRAYAEMDWIYEAEQLLSTIKQSEIKSINTALYASVNADLLLKQKQYKEAIPFLEMALEREKNKSLRQRFTFLLAQLYAATGEKTKAYNAFTAVIKLNPPYAMDFNARICRAELNTKHVSQVRKDLKRMLKNPNNKDYVDKIYFTLGKTYLNHGDTIHAIENFKLAAEKSVLNGYDKALALFTLGDLYYDKRKYVDAQPPYDASSKILTVTDDDYTRVFERAENLGELVQHYEIVTLQDSLQNLAKLSEEEQLAVINAYIEKLKAEEEAAAKAAAEEEENRTLRELNENNSNSLEPNFGRNPMPNAGGAQAGWYFYNPNLVRTGKSDFIKRWGNRKLEDNWRRTSKASALFAENETQNYDNEMAADSTAIDTTNVSQLTNSDNKDPQFYLQQIPRTAEMLAQSNADIAAALFAMGIIYRTKIEDLPLAVETFEEFTRRFPQDSSVVDAYYECYVAESKMNDSVKADGFRQKIIREFPSSRYAQALSQPDYFERMKRMYAEQDSVYDLTYRAYLQSDFAVVKNNTATFRAKYPMSSLMPKFLFLNALSVGKTDSARIFERELNDLITLYPQSDVSAMSKDILALIRQGKEAQTGASSGTLLAMRNTQDSIEANTDVILQFSADKTLKHRLLLVATNNLDSMNRLLFNIATFNFTKFIIKDFDLFVTRPDSAQSILAITNFDSYAEAEWYINSIDKNLEIKTLLDTMTVEPIIISETNYALLETTFTMKDYLQFAKQDIENQNDTVQNLQSVLPPPESMAMRNDSVKYDFDNLPETTLPAAKEEDENVPLYKNLFGYTPNSEHYVAIVVRTGAFDFGKLTTVFDTYNAQNYGVLNLKLSKENVGSQQVVIIGKFPDSDVAKSYLMRMVKERAL